LDENGIESIYNKRHDDEKYVFAIVKILMKLLLNAITCFDLRACLLLVRGMTF